MMNAKLLILITLNNILIVYCLEENSHDSSCTMGYKCVPVNKCFGNHSIVYPCDSQLNHICCPQSFDTRQTTVSSKVFPDNCGIIPISDRIRNGEEAALGQFPWMALLGYTQQELALVQFLCGGTLISNQYVLTAAHCLGLHSNLILSTVRLGESNLATPIDCEGDKRTPTCALPHVDAEVEKLISHQNYNNVTYENDIALVKLKNPVNYTLYVLPVCLPFNSFNFEPLKTNEKVLISGWGRINSDQVGGSTTLMFASVQLWDPSTCNDSLPVNVKPIKDSQICASGEKHQDSCKGDSGGPMTKSVIFDQDIRHLQIGIVSFSSSRICGETNSPTVYTKVQYYLDWITNNVK